jgi:acetyl-CoA synthetase
MPIRPNLDDYAAIRDNWSWDSVREELDGLPGGGINKAYECLDRHRVPCSGKERRRD